VAGILRDAAGADAIVTVCPMCQINLEAYQAKARKAGGRSVPVLYLTQLMGLAMGLTEQDVQLAANLTMTPAVRRGIAARAWAVPAPEDGEEITGLNG
jgi:heterodisulfide reductase subunit B